MECRRGDHEAYRSADPSPFEVRTLIALKRLSSKEAAPLAGVTWERVDDICAEAARRLGARPRVGDHASPARRGGRASPVLGPRAALPNPRDHVQTRRSSHGRRSLRPAVPFGRSPPRGWAPHPPDQGDRRALALWLARLAVPEPFIPPLVADVSCGEEAPTPALGFRPETGRPATWRRSPRRSRRLSRQPSAVYGRLAERP